MRKCVLVVDDDQSIRESLKKVLQVAGYEVVLAADGVEATLRVDPGPIDLLLLDLGLPDQSGWDVLERLRARCPSVPVIIITGLSDQSRTARAAGVAALFEKPVEAAALLKRMEELLTESPEARVRRLHEPLEDTPHAPATVGPVRERQAQRLAYTAARPPSPGRSSKCL